MTTETKLLKPAPVERGVMPSEIKISDYPADFIPAGAVEILGVDIAPGGDCTVKGFYDPRTGEYHIQEVVHNA